MSESGEGQLMADDETSFSQEWFSRRRFLLTGATPWAVSPPCIFRRWGRRRQVRREVQAARSLE
jgi:hypothetical protein